MPAKKKIVEEEEKPSKKAKTSTKKAPAKKESTKKESTKKATPKKETAKKEPAKKASTKKESAKKEPKSKKAKAEPKASKGKKAPPKKKGKKEKSEEEEEEEEDEEGEAEEEVKVETKVETKVEVPEAPVAVTADDPCGLASLFTGAEAWETALRPVLAAQPDVAKFLGPSRAKSIVPVREMTLQALRANTPEKWNVVIFGQNPYPRVESATGVAMFDNTFHSWSDPRFSVVTSMRCIMKCAALSVHKDSKNCSVGDLRALLAKDRVVQPPEWFQAILSQGCLLLNASLTTSTDCGQGANRRGGPPQPKGELTQANHKNFWRPVMAALLREIMRAKSVSKSNRGVVFAWWGDHARALQKMVWELEEEFTDVKVEHIEYCNPAALGDAFAQSNHFGEVNASLTKLGLHPINWLPTAGWEKSLKGVDAEETKRMGEFVQHTIDLHKTYLERLQGAKDEKSDELQPITGIGVLPLPSFAECIVPLLALGDKALTSCCERAAAYKTTKSAGITDDHASAIYLYTLEGPLYKTLNAALRDPDRSKAPKFFSFLRLFFDALTKLTVFKASLWRGVALDLRKIYPKGAVVTWWGVSSCTSKREVASGFLGSTGTRMLFEIETTTAVSIMDFSAFKGEAEYILAPGTQLKVDEVERKSDGLVLVKLSEMKGRLVK